MKPGTRLRARVSGPEIRSMFARIVGRYDLLNHLLSFHLDRLWRRKAVRLARVGREDHVLDVCAGTGDLSLAFARKLPAGRVTATDFCAAMIQALPEKAARKGMLERVQAGVADSLRLPFRDASFDVASVAFGIRNLEDPVRGIGEMARVLRPGGRLVILEFSYPRRFPMRTLYGAYRRVIPWIARVVCASDRTAYEYLNRSVREFSESVDLPGILAGHGLVDVSTTPLAGGIVEVNLGVKPAPSH